MILAALERSRGRCTGAEAYEMLRRRLHLEDLTRSVIGAFFTVYNTLGYGFFEHVYSRALHMELVARGHTVHREVWVPVFYNGAQISQQRLDFIVDGRLVVENKATRRIHSADLHQLYSYLKSTKFEVGLLLHFGPKARFYRVFCPNREEPSTCIDQCHPI
jgi:GxxExxY protein